MHPPPITPSDLACALAGDRVGPEDAAAFMGVTLKELAEMRRREGRGPAFTRMGSRLVRYGMDDLLAWRTRTV